VSNSPNSSRWYRFPGFGRSNSKASLNANQPQARKFRRRRGKAVPGIESLEIRQLMAQVVWDGGAGSLNWADAGNWGGDALPTASDDVVIPDLAENVTIESQGAVDIRSLTSQESLLVSAGTFALNDADKSSSIAGTLSISNSTMTVTGPLEAHDFSLSNGTITGAGDVAVIGALGWHDGGTMSGAGTTTSHGTMTIDGNYKNLVGRTLLNLGIANLSGYRFSTYDGAVIHNNAGATWNFAADSDIRQETGAASLFVNDGIITKTGGGGWASFSIPVQNNANVLVSSGGLQFSNGGTASSTAKYTVTSDATGGLALYGGLTLAVGSSISQTGPGRVYLADADIHGTYSADATQTQGGTTTFHDDANILTLGNELVLNTGSLILESMAGTQSVLDLNLYYGTLTLPSGADWSIATTSLYRSTITGSLWNLTVTDSLGWHDGSTMSGAGTTTALGTLVIDGTYTSLGGRTLLNQGAANISAYRFSTYDGSIIRNSQGATWNFAADSDIRQETGAASLFISDGYVTKSAGTGWAYFNVPVENHGSIIIVSGGIAFNSLDEGLRWDAGAGLIVESDSAIRVNGSFLGSTVDPQSFVPDGTTILSGGSSTSPNSLEAMGRDLGPYYTGFYENFSFGTLQLESGYFKLVDQSDNAAGTGTEAIYVDTLIVPAGSTLDLNGYALYARVAHINGTILGGTVTLLPSVGSFATTTSVLSSHPSSTYGYALTFTATISAVSEAAGTPIGSVQFLVDGANFGLPLNLANGVATSGPLSTLGAGTHTVSAVYSGKYLFGTSTAANLSQTVAKAELVIEANDAAKVAGDANPSFSGTYTGFVNGDGSGSLTTLPVFSTTATIASPAGQYLITAAGAASNNYAISYLSGTLTVTSNTVATMTTVQASTANPTYGDTLTFTAIVASSSAMPTGSVRFLIDGVNFGSTVAFVNGAATSLAISSLGAGAHSVSAVYLGESYFEASTSTPLPVTVAKRSLVIAVSDATKVYGQANPTFAATYTGFANGNSAASLTTPPTFATAATAASGVGTYAVTASGATASNYAIAYQAGSLSVTKAGLTIKADNKTKVYGRANPTLTVSFTGFVNGETDASLSYPAAVSTAATTASAAGNYAITAIGAASPNYAITYEPGTLTVTKSGLTIKVNDATKVYGQDNISFSATYTGFINGDTSSNLASPPAFSTIATAASPVGAYAITAAGAASNNYTITNEPGSLNVSKAALTVTADNQSILTGSAIPPLTYAITGFVNSDTVGVVTGSPVLSTGATPLSPSGTYTITVGLGSLSASNYNFTSLVAGTLTLRPRSTADNGLTLSLDHQSVTEGGTVAATITRNWVTSEPLTVYLSYASLYPQNPQLDLALSVTIPAGQASATFTFSAVNDEVPEKDESISLSATAADFIGTSTSLIVTDDDLPVLSIEPSTTSIYENGGGITFVVRRQTVTGQPLTVRLSTSDDAIAGATATVIIPAGQATATFTLTPVDNAVVDGNRPLTVYAKGAFPLCGCTMQTGWGTAAVVVIDDDAPALTLSADQTSALEGVAGAFHLTITRNTSTNDDLVVSLSSADPTMLIVPATVTIPIGQTSITVDLSTGSDGISRPPVTVVLTVSAPGLASSSKTFTVMDRDTADLRASQVAIASSGLIGQTTTVTWVVANTGSIPSTAPWLERIYLSKDEVLDGADTLAAELNVQTNLLAGSSTSRSAAITLPGVPGFYYAIVVVDATNVIAEPNEADNRAISTSSVAVLPTYTATVSADVPVAVVGTPIHLSGLATLQGTSTPAVNVAVTVRVVAENGIRRVITATTDASGQFAATFTPVSNEAGTYGVAAAYPSVAEDAIQSQFKLVGMRSDAVDGLSLRLLPGTVFSGTVALSNSGSVPLTGLSVSIMDVPANVTLSASVSSTNLAGNGNLQLSYSAMAQDASIRQQSARIRVMSAEGAMVEVTVAIQVVPLTAQLVTPIEGLVDGVVRGQQKVVAFEVANTGGAATGALEVQLPDGIPWLTVGSSTTISSLAPGQKAIVTLILTPPRDAPLALFEGSIILGGSDVETSVDFHFRTISAAVGDLTITVSDEYTYFAAGSPHVAGTVIRLLDPYDNTIVIASGVTDAQGQLALPNLPEGFYVLETADTAHVTTRLTIEVKGGISNQQNIFIQRHTVTYQWVISPSSIADQYEISLQSSFRTGVPIPVVVMSGPTELPDLNPGESVQVNLTLTNYGLIAADGVQLSLPDAGDYVFTALKNDIGTLPALSEITVPVIISRRVSASAAASSDLGVQSGQSGASAVDEYGTCLAGWLSSYYYKCAGLTILKQAILALGRLSCRYSVDGAAAAIRGLSGAGGGGGGGGITGGGSGGLRVTYVLTSSGDCIALPPGDDELTGNASSVDLATNSDGGFGAAASEGVCATVRIEIDQKAVVTRSALSASLAITNGSALQDLTALHLNFRILDSNGNDATQKFFVQTPVLTNLSAVDGTGVVGGGKTGQARFTIIPSTEAASSDDAQYALEGTLSYIDPETNLEVTIPLVSSTFSVLPSPQLILNYFQQRDVISDDPFTQEAEPAEPFTLGLIVSNVGHGTANSLTITSAQPRIIDNEKGLLIDFQIVGSQVGGQSSSPSLTVDLGDIAQGQSQLATWSLTSSLLGQFIEYSASFEHSDALG
jgi:uncharacterized membrane protein